MQQQHWHWQERFEPVDVENACRRQIHKIHKSLSYHRWLKQKAQEPKGTYQQENECNESDDQRNQEEIDAAFRDWLRKKNKQARMTRNHPHEGVSKEDNNQPSIHSAKWCGKPSSLHVNPKTKKNCTRTAEATVGLLSRSKIAPPVRQRPSDIENQLAYETWLARVRREDQVRRKQRQDEILRRKQQRREQHEVTWRKKLAVCAYSTNVPSNTNCALDQ